MLNKKEKLFNYLFLEKKKIKFFIIDVMTNSIFIVNFFLSKDVRIEQKITI